MLKNKITLRAANLSDSGAIVSILQESGLFPDINAETRTNVEDSISKYLMHYKSDENHMIMVAESPDGEVLGYIGVHWLHYMMASDTRGYVSELFVRPSARGMGIGRKLLEVVKEKAIERGCSRLMVVNVPNRITYPRRFFLKVGWKERQEIANFILPLHKLTV